MIAVLNLGVALDKIGRTDRAISHWETALRLNSQLKGAAESIERIRSKSSERKQ